MSRDITPGDIDIKRCVLKSLDGEREFNFINQVAYIDIFEGITQPLITGEIVVRDSIGLLRSFPIIGEEYVELEFSTPSLKTRKYKLNVERVGGLGVDATKKSMVYTLSVVSSEQFTNATTLVSQRYTGTIGDTVKIIANDYLKVTKPVDVAPTTGIDSQIVSNLTPLQAIDKLRHRAISSQFSSSSFVFFEDIDRFRFLTIEEMIKNSKEPVANYYYDDVVNADVTQSRFYDIINFYQVQTQATTERLHAGGAGSVVKKYDMITGTVEDVVFNELQHAGTFEKSGKHAKDSTSTLIQANARPAFKMIMPWSNDKDNEELADKKGLLNSFVTKIMQNIVHINIFGNSDLKLGDSLRCTVVKGTGLTGDNNVATNNYVVSKIRHCIHNSNRPSYSQALEGINNSFDS